MTNPELGTEGEEPRGRLGWNTMFEIGDHIDGRRIDARLGASSGGMVFRCANGAGEPIAIRVVSLSSPELRKQVIQRGTALGRLEHPNVVRTLDLVDHEDFVAITMALVDGPTLVSLLDGKMAPGRILGLGLQLASALAYVHAQSILHGDIRPGNARVGEAGRLVLLDFPLLAPTPIESGISSSTDVYGWGRTLFELATGRAGSSPGPRARVPPRHLGLDPGTGVPPALRELVRRATHPDPTHRPTAEAMVLELTELSSSRFLAIVPSSPSGPFGPRKGPHSPLSPAADRSSPTDRQAPRSTGSTSGVWTDRTGRTFRLLSELGRGGFGVVHLAEVRTPAGLVRRVALKLLHSHLDPASQAVARMRDEADILVRLHHPVIVAVHDLAEFPDRIGLMFEYVDGQDLTEGISDPVDPVPFRAALEIVGQIAGALDEAWIRLKLVHRDVKPANIRIGRHGTIKLLDFGIARSRALPRTTHTESHVVVGSFRYLAPERFGLTRDPEPPSDVFSLGCVLFEATAGERLFEVMDVPDLLGLIRGAEELEAHVRARLDACLLPERREVRRLLESMLSFDARWRPSAHDVALQCESLAGALSESGSLRSWCRRRTWLEPDEVPEDSEPPSTRFEPRSPPVAAEVPVRSEPPSSTTLAAAPAIAPSGRGTLWLVLLASTGSSALAVALAVGLVAILVGWFLHSAPTDPTPLQTSTPVEELPPESMQEQIGSPSPPTPVKMRRTATPAPVKAGRIATPTPTPTPTSVEPVEPVEPVPAAPPPPETEPPAASAVVTLSPESAVTPPSGPIVIELRSGSFTHVQVNCSDGYMRRVPVTDRFARFPDVPLASRCLAHFVGAKGEPKRVMAGETLVCWVDLGVKCTR